MLKPLTLALLALLALPAASIARADDLTLDYQSCSISAQTVGSIQKALAYVVANEPDDNGSLFKPRPSRMWSAVVDRTGRLCSIIRSDPDAWPGSRAIAIAKAASANDFSNNLLALSTANLYAPTQPGGSLYGLNNSNPFNPAFNSQTIQAVGQVVGGVITFGGGVALYNGSGNVIGGLGVSGDSSCADHAIAFRMRQLSGFDNTPGSKGADNIQYLAAGEPSDTGFKQPHCSANDITP